MAELQSVGQVVFQGCRVHRGYNVKNCTGCVEESLQRLVTAVDALIGVLEERHQQYGEGFKAVQAALTEGYDR